MFKTEEHSDQKPKRKKKYLKIQNLLLFSFLFYNVFYINNLLILCNCNLQYINVYKILKYIAF